MCVSKYLYIKFIYKLDMYLFSFVVFSGLFHWN